MGRFFLALFIALSGAASAQTNSPYDFKGIPLGISIDEFRAIPYPEANAEWAARLSHAVACDRARFSAGSTECAWGFSTLVQSPLVLGAGGRGTRNYAFLFAPDEAGIERLYGISLRGYVESTEPVIAALTARFGRARSREVVPLTNGYGARYHQTIAIWRNANSMITVRSPSGEARYMDIEYEYTPLANIVRRRAAERDRQQNARPM